MLAKGENKADVSESMIRFLDYVGAELEDSEKDVVNMINNEDNPELLMSWLIQATKSENIEQFIDGIKNN